MSKVFSTLSISMAAAISFSALAQNDISSAFNEWQTIASRGEQFNQLLSNNRTKVNHALSTNISLLNQLLLDDQQSIVITLPLPDGQFVDFILRPSSIMQAELGEKYPTIKTFSGQQVEQPENHGRFDITPQGFHGLFKFGEETVFIEPQYRNNNTRYVSYFRKDAKPIDEVNMPKQHAPKKKNEKASEFHRQFIHSAKQTAQKAGQLKTYRIAVSATGEYTQFHGGTKEKGLAAVVTMINRVNDVYQQDLGVKLELVANNDALIFVDAASDPFENNDSDGEKNTAVIDKAIGNSSYDIGHIVNTGGGGLAVLGALCDPDYKGDGMTGSEGPTSDAFYIDYVAHEIGHQFGAEHTFNGEAESCEGNRVDTSAYEPGSGSTVMSYAGICGSQNLQDHSNPFFHSHSIDQMEAHIATTSSQCGTTTASNKVAPTVNAGADYTIPAKTPFTLIGSASSASNAALTYDWQQYDLGPASANASEQVDDGKRSLFRVWSPNNKSSRTFPRLEDILQNKTSLGETLPTTNRELNFRLVVRDSQNSIAYDSMKVKVVDTKEAFAVTEPSAGITWASSKQMVKWNSANTTAAPISCPKVNIQLSTNGGTSFDTDLAMAVDNNGSYEVNTENVSTENARIKVSCANNIFFAINKGDFSISSGEAQNITITGVKNPLRIEEDHELVLSTAMFQYQGKSPSSLSIQAGKNYTVNGMTISPKANFHGELSVTLTASNGEVVSKPFNASVSVTSVNDAPVATNDNVEVDEGSVKNIIAALANDTDVDVNDKLIIKAVNYSGQGSVNIEDNKIEYSPTTGFSGKESISYIIEDSAKVQASAVITISVKAKNTGTNTNTGSSSGGSFAWLLLILFTVLTCRLTGSKSYE